jgi:ABC-2 type transport system permease protein
MWQRIYELVRKEFRQVLRDPRLRTFLIVPPVMQAIIFGFAVNLDIEDARIAWMDGDRTAESRELREAFDGSPVFSIAASPASAAEAHDLMDGGKVQAVIGVLPGFSRSIHRGAAAGVQILVDGTNSNTASLVASYANQVVAAYSAGLADRRQNQRLLARGAQSAMPAHLPSVDARTRVWFNPELRSRNYFVPGITVNIIMIVTVMLTALAIVREKEIGTMEQLMVTPIRPLELMIGKLVPFALIGILDLALITGIALWIFSVPFRGNALFLLLCSILFLMTTLGAGLFLSTISNTQQQAIMSMFFLTVPLFMLSGFAFPIANMPQAIQWFTYLNPARYFMEIVRGIFLKGAGMAVLWPQMLGLLFFGVAIMAFSALRFSKRLD